MFRVRVIGDDQIRVVVELSGALDLVSIAEFERVIAEVLSHSPKELVFDLTQTHFISAQGYAAMGRCSLGGVHVLVRAKTELTSKIFAICGYDRIRIVTAQEPA